MSTPIALWLADKLEDPESAHGYRLVANNAADELRRLQQENEQLKAQRTWVGLNLDERLELAQDVDWAAGAYCKYAEKVEAKLREKNT